MKYSKICLLLLISGALLFLGACGPKKSNEGTPNQEGKELTSESAGEIEPGLIGKTAKKAPDFSLFSIEGEQITLSNLAGKKIVVLNFWAVWCPTCREEIPKLKSLYEKYKDKVIILGIAVNYNQTKKRVAGFAKKNNIEYTVLWDDLGKVSKLYGVSFVPMNVIIDKDGTLLNENANLSDIESVLK